MKQHKSVLFLTSIMILLSACNSKKEFISLPDNIQGQIESTDAYVVECPKEMQADVESSNIAAYTGGGLLFALVDCAITAHRQDSAKNLMIDLQKQLMEFNLEERFKSKFEQTLKNADWLHLCNIYYVKDLNDKTYEEILPKVKSDTVLTAQFNYKLNPEFNVLTGTLYLTLYPASSKIKKMVNTENTANTPIFKFNVSATASLPYKGEDIDENAKRWAQNKGAYLKKALENIVDQIGFSVEQALKHPTHLPEE